jgi:HEAT repeat protein
VNALSAIGGDRVLEAMVDIALHNADENVRESAKNVLVKIGGEPKVEKLIAALSEVDAGSDGSDISYGVCVNAAYVLGEIHGKRLRNH